MYTHTEWGKGQKALKSARPKDMVDFGNKGVVTVENHSGGIDRCCGCTTFQRISQYTYYGSIQLSKVLAFTPGDFVGVTPTPR